MLIIYEDKLVNKLRKKRLLIMRIIEHPPPPKKIYTQYEGINIEVYYRSKYRIIVL